MTRNSNLEPLNLVTSGCFLYRKNNTVEGVRCSGRGSIPDVVILPIVYPKYKKAIIPHVQKLLGGHLIMSDNSHGICGSLPSYTWKGKEKKTWLLCMHILHNIIPTPWLVSVGPGIT